MDPLQFAYQPDIGVDNAIIFLLDRSLSHLEKPRSTVRIMFSYFSSAFNTIQPAILRDKLKLTGLDQYLKVLGPRLPRQLATVCEDSGLHVGHNICRTGYKPPLAPFLSTLSTAGFSHPSHHSHLQKFIDDCAITSLIRAGTTKPTENLLRALVTGASGTTSSSTLRRPKSWWWISTGTNNPAYR